MQKLNIIITVVLFFIMNGCSSESSENTCVLGETHCLTDSQYEICMGENEWWTADCNSDQKCVADACRAIICDPGNRYCAGDNVTVLQCHETGTYYEEIGDCGGPEVGGLCSGNGQCVGLCNPDGKSYIGCEYFAVDLDNAFVSAGGSEYLDAASEQFSVVVSNTENDVSAIVAVTTKDVVIASAIIPPRGIKVFDLPASSVNGTIVGPYAYRVASNVPINAYQFNPLENVDVFSNDASLLLPTHTLGTKYVIMTREQTFRNLKSFLTVVAASPGETQVKVTVSATTLAGLGIPAMEAGDDYYTVLQHFDVLNIETNDIGADLTGSLVESDQPVAVFAGSEAANVPNTNHCGDDGYCEYDEATPCITHEDCSRFITCCADHLEQQLFSTDTWGKHYIIARSFPRGEEADYIRIMALENRSEIQTNPDIGVCLLDRGQWCELRTMDDVEIIADKPIMVGQFLAAEQAPEPNIDGYMQPGDAAIGDPAFILSVPVEQYRQEYVFLAPNKYELDYISIVVPPETAVILDNIELSSHSFKSVGSGNYLAGRFAIADGFHSLYLTKPGSVIVYGYDDYVSYGYPGGLNLNVLDGSTE